MKIITLKREEFDEFARNHRYNSFYQSSDYADFSKANGQYNFHYLGFVDENNRLIGASLMLYKELFWGYKFAYAPRGILIDYENAKLINAVVANLKKLLKKQKFIFITIDPPIVASEKDQTGNTLKFNSQVNKILGSFKKNDFRHLGFTLYNESILPRWTVIASLNPDPRAIYNSLSNEIKEKLNYCNSVSLYVRKNNILDTNDFFNLVKPYYSKRALKYYQDFFNFFNEDGRIKVFYAVIDTKKYTSNANNLYSKEEEKNNTLAEIIQSGDKVKFNISKAINDKIASDKLLHIYKNDVVSSAQLLKQYPDGLVCGAAIVIEETNGASIILNYSPKEYERYNTSALLTYEIMKYYGAKNKSYLNLGAITGNFDPSSKYYSMLSDKLGYNSVILEYIGQFDIVLNPILYKIYKRKNIDIKKV